MTDELPKNIVIGRKKKIKFRDKYGKHIEVLTESTQNNNGVIKALQGTRISNYWNITKEELETFYQEANLAVEKVREQRYF